MDHNKPNFIFFGTPGLAVNVLDQLEAAGYIPALIITREDKPAGRKLVLTPPPTKVWALARGIPVMQPQSLKDPHVLQEIRAYAPVDLSIVVAYGRIIPQTILDIPTHGSINLHPSLLPKLRGPSPIESAIVTENETGVSIMMLDHEMDHGPVLAQEKVDMPEWPPYADELEATLARHGGKLLVETIPRYLSGTIQPVAQDHTQATLCQKIKKEDALLDLSDISPKGVEKNLRKIRAYVAWPRAYFFMPTKEGSTMRVIVSRARKDDGKLIIEKVIPEGKKEMTYEDFKNGFNRSNTADSLTGLASH